MTQPCSLICFCYQIQVKKWEEFKRILQLEIQTDVQFLMHWIFVISNKFFELLNFDHAK